MPTYDYRCDKCRAEFSQVEPISKHGSTRVICPKCKSTSVSQIFSPLYVKTVKKS
jgi:putative FmdB family regulatory protein